MALGGWLGGFLFDVSGDCTGSIAAAILTTCVGIPLALALPRHQRPPSASTFRSHALRAYRSTRSTQDLSKSFAPRVPARVPRGPST